MAVRNSLLFFFFFFKPAAKEQQSNPNYSIQSRREPKMLALQKHWEAVQAYLADEICFVGLK